MEKETLRMRRAVSRQYYQTDLLLDMHARLRLQIQQRTSPAIAENYATASPTATKPRTQSFRTDSSTHSPGSPTHPPLPLMRWEQPARQPELQ